MTIVANRFDLIVIGDGAAGDSVVRPAASSGKHVALVEKDRLGGANASTTAA